ncbi:MAG: thioredoxin-like domain-containing protein [Bacteroidota bacterium]
MISLKNNLQIRYLQLSLIAFVLIFQADILSAQQISGHLKYHSLQEIRLLGYEGFNTTELTTTTIDSLGNFELTFNPIYKGMGYLETSDNGRLFLVLNEPNIIIYGAHLNEPDSILFKNSLENNTFSQYAVDHNSREAALAGWKYLLPLYQNVDILKVEHENLIVIEKEIERLENQDSLFLNGIDRLTYVSWYLPMRKLIDDMPLSTQRYPERIPKHIAEFRTINFNDVRLYNSGILDDILEGHYLMLENEGQQLDSIFTQMNLSTDYIIQNLDDNYSLLNDVSNYLFDLMERRSLFAASEYLAITLLKNNSCVLEDVLASQLETYRAMKVGNTAPDITFLNGNTNGGVGVSQSVDSLSEIENKSVLVVFGASWCSKCTQEISKMSSYYNAWKAKGLEVIFISLDTDEKSFNEFTEKLPWLSYCDFKGWESKPAKDYYIFSTPTMFILDKEKNILIRPNSVEHVDAWVKYKM